MAHTDVEALLSKAVSDPVFRQSLGKDFHKTVDVHNLALTHEEAAALKAVNWNQSLTGATAAGTWVHIYKSVA